MNTARRPIRDPESGSILVMTLLLLLVLGGLTATLSSLNVRFHKEHERARDDLRAFHAAEAGLNESLAVLMKNNVAGVQALDFPRETSTGAYRVELLDGRDDHAIDADRIRLRSVGTAGRDPAGTQLMIDHVPTGAYAMAVFGAKGVELRSNVMIDSFDPADGPYPAKVDYVNDAGNVGSYEKVTFHSNVEVHGDALVGETGVFDDSAPGIDISGDQEAGPINVMMPSIGIPLYPNKGALLVSSTTTLAPGNYHYGSISISGTLTVRGPATVVVDGFSLLKGSLIADDSAGPVKVIATGGVNVKSNTIIGTTSGRATAFELLMTTVSKPVTFSSNGTFTGVMYAPNTKLTIPSNYTVYGSVKASSVELSSNVKIHFDEGLLYDPNAADIYELVSWRRLSQEEIGEVGLPVVP